MNKSYRIVTAAIAIASLLPLMLVHMEMWDGVLYAEGYRTNDLSYLDPMLWMGKHLTVWGLTLLQKVALLTGIPHKFFTNVLTVASILGVARETYKYLVARFSLSPESATIASWFVLAYPIWHIFITAANSDYVFYFWLFMAAVNLRGTRPVAAVLLLLVSLQFYSLFAFAIGFACTDFFMDADRANYRRKALGVILFSAVLLAGFVILNVAVNIHGAKATDNTFKIERLVSFAHFAILAGAVFAVWAVARIRWLDARQSERWLRLSLSFLALSFFAALAYWAVGRPMRFFSFGSYGSRHTILCAVPFAMAVGLGAEALLARGRTKLLRAVAALLATAAVVVLYQGYDHKVAALMYKDMMVESLRRVEEPPAGYISIAAVGYEAPRHFQKIDTNDALHMAYGKQAWQANGFWARRGHVYAEPDMHELYPAANEEDRKWVLAKDFRETAFTRYDFILENYHQEGRIWYWYNYLARDYTCFQPRLVKL